MTALLDVQAVQKRFGVTPALRDASLRIEPGEIVAVMGPSGSGKSTLLHCAAGIVLPDAGEVQFRGRSLVTMSDGDRSALRRREFGFVFQFGQLVPELTCAENVELPLRLTGVDHRAARLLAATWLDRLDVGGVAGQRPGEVSGGQGQRVAVARALVAAPAVIFADEPTGALDSLASEQVMGLLTDAVRETDAALVLVTHEARLAAYSDREVVVRDGRTESTGVAA